MNNSNTNTSNNTVYPQSVPRAQKKVHNHGGIEIIPVEPRNRTDTHTENTIRGNISIIQQVRDIVKQSFGPNALSVLITTPNNKIVSTSDGATILSHLNVTHPVCKLLQNGCFSMDHFYGDGTTSTFLLSASIIERGYFSTFSEGKLLELNLGIQEGLEIALNILNSPQCIVLEFENESFKSEEIERIINCALGSKVSLHTDFVVKLLADAVSMLYANNHFILQQNSNDINYRSTSTVELPYSTKIESSSDSEIDTLLEELETEYKQHIDNVLDEEFNSKKFVFDAGDIKFSAITGSSVTDSFAINGYLLKQTPLTSEKEKKNASIALLSCGVERERMKAKHYDILDTPDRVRRWVADEEKIFHSQADFIHNCNVSVVFSGGDIHPVALERFNELGIVCLEHIDSYSLETLSKVTNTPVIHKLSALEPNKTGFADIVSTQEFSNRQFTIVKNDSQIINHQQSEQPNRTSRRANRPVSVIIRGPTLEHCEEYIRYARDALKTVEVITSKNSKVVCGGGAAELECASQLNQYINRHSTELTPVQKQGIRIVAESLQDLVRTLAENAGLEPGAQITNLDQAHKDGMRYVGIHADASIIHESNVFSFIDPSVLEEDKQQQQAAAAIENCEETRDMLKSGIFDALETKKAVFTTAVDLACTILSLKENIANKYYVFQQKANQQQKENNTESHNNRDFDYF